MVSVVLLGKVVVVDDVAGEGDDGDAEAGEQVAEPAKDGEGAQGRGAGERTEQGYADCKQRMDGGMEWFECGWVLTLPGWRRLGSAGGKTGSAAVPVRCLRRERGQVAHLAPRLTLRPRVCTE